MKLNSIFTSILLLLFFTAAGQNDVIERAPSLVDYDAFKKLVLEVEPHRQERLIDVPTFVTMSNQKNSIILDTRSKEMYDAKHIKGAIHLNFSDFTQTRLEELIPDQSTTILIYCNNNIEDDELFFPTKMYVPPTIKTNSLGITMALNIPTYINLYGYGYKNVYELSEMISAFESRIQMEGSEVIQSLIEE